MIELEKLLAGMEHCDSVGLCTECKYPSEWITETTPKCTLLQDAAAAIRELVEENERLRAELYNCRLYLSEMFADAGMERLMENRHPGLPGYADKECEG